MRDLVTEAARVAISLERKCYEFYRRAALTVPEEMGRQIFERLAVEEASHLDAMTQVSPDCCCEEQPAYQQQEFGRGFSAPNGRLAEQLRLALLNKQFSIDLYTALADSFREPTICSMLQGVLLTAREELDSIRREYLAGIPAAEATFSRRPRRVHIRGGIPTVINKHTQLFFSMMDAGRHSKVG